MFKLISINFHNIYIKNRNFGHEKEPKFFSNIKHFIFLIDGNGAMCLSECLKLHISRFCETIQ